MVNRWEVWFEVKGQKSVRIFRYFMDAYFCASKNKSKNPVIYQCNDFERKIVDWRIF